MKKYLSLFRIRFIGRLQYRAAAIGGICTQLAWGSMFLLMFAAFYRSDPSSIPMPYEQLASYIWLHQAFIILFTIFVFDSENVRAITEGGIAYEMSRPLSLYNMWFTHDFATRTSGAMLRFFPILLVASFLPKPYGLTAPVSFTAFFAFIISLFLGVWLASSIVMMQYLFIFKTMSPAGVRAIVLSVSEIFSGSLIPLPFFPNGIRQVVEALPLASLHNVPLRIYVGNIAGEEIIFRILLQLFWCITITTIGKLMMNRQLKNVVVQGG